MFCKEHSTKLPLKDRADAARMSGQLEVCGMAVKFYRTNFHGVLSENLYKYFERRSVKVQSSGHARPFSSSYNDLLHPYFVRMLTWYSRRM